MIRRIGRPTNLALFGLTLVAGLSIAGGALLVIQGGSIDTPTEPSALQLLSDDATHASLFVDTDRDGLTDLLENYVFGSDPNKTFTHGGHVPDGWLARFGQNPAVPGSEAEMAVFPGPGEAPAGFGPGGLPANYRMPLRDVYLWGRPADWDETSQGPWENGIDPRQWDQGAGIAFSWLLVHDLDPFDPAIGSAVLAPLPEGDGLTVLRSYETATDPRAVDSDGDGLRDDVELTTTKTNPARFDTAGYGVADGWAVHHGLAATDPRMPLDDPDHDGLTNAAEYNASVELVGLQSTLRGEGLDPNSLDTGGVGLPEGWLVLQGLDPFEAGIAEKVVQRSTDFEPAKERGVVEVALTVRDAYLWERPSSWDEVMDGPWFGGLSAATNDTDGDGLPDAVEIAGWMLNVTLGSTDGVAGGEAHVFSDPLTADSDGDGLTDAEEFLGRVVIDDETVDFPPTDPKRRDTDFDGLADRVEVVDIVRLARENGMTGRPLDPTVQDSDDDFLIDGEEFRYWSTRSARYRDPAARYEFENRVTDPVIVLGGMPGTRPKGQTATSDSVADAFAPWGDLDGDGIINMLDPDADGDGLLDGWEVAPENYAQTPYASEHPRRATDPGNHDTDGDDLPDGWEVRYGAWDHKLGGWNLDAATWSSFGDDVADGDRDLDDDAISWYTFHADTGGHRREAHEFVATNRLEFEHGTDPNRASTTGIGLLDSWTIFWGILYPELSIDELGDVYPGAPGPVSIPLGQPRPSPTQALDEVTDRSQRLRFSLDARPGAGEQLAAVYRGAPDASTGQTRDVYQFSTHLDLTFSAHQEAVTNPYLQDTDGDGAPDAWEIVYVSSGATDPLVDQRGADADGDGLDLLEEYTKGTDPGAADTDLGGVEDGEESNPVLPTNPLDPSDDIRLRDPTIDSDGDGVPDVSEVRGWQHPKLGLVRTDPQDPDTDGDGLADGHDIEISEPTDPSVAKLRSAGVVELPTTGGGVRFLGEADRGGDPRLVSTAKDGTPDGWRAHHGLTLDERASHFAIAYTHARPPWWREDSMGTWWWGASPHIGADVDGDGTDDAIWKQGRFVVVDRDLDEDGLDDVNGEDPTPGARHASVPPQGFPDAPGSTAAQRREAGHAFGVPLAERGAAGGRDTDGDAIRDAADRVPATIESISFDAPVDGGSLQLEAGRTYNATGRVFATPSNGAKHPVRNATVVVHLWDLQHPLGFGTTDPEGRFTAPFSLSVAHQANVVPPSGSFLGQVRAPVTWEIALDGLDLGRGTAEQPNQLRLQLLNTSGAARPGDPTHLSVSTALETPSGGSAVSTAQGVIGTVSDATPFALVARSVLTLDVPERLDVGQPLEIILRLEDAAGRPVSDAPVTLTIGDEGSVLHTAEDGTARRTVTGSTGAPGTLDVRASFAGRGDLQGAETTRTVRILHPTRIDLAGISPVPAKADQILVVRGRLATIVPPSGLPMLVKVGDVQQNLTTGPEGDFESKLRLPRELDRAVMIGLVFEGDDDRASATVQVEVPLTSEPRIGLSTPSPMFRRGEEGILAITVTDPRGRPLPGPVTVDGLPGSTDAKTVSIGKDGTTTITWTVSGELGGHIVEVKRAAGDGFDAARNETWITVRSPAILRVERPTLYRGQGSVVGGFLEDAAGEGIVGGRVELVHAGSTVATAMTDGDGRFALSWSVPARTSLGPIDLQVVFRPTDREPWEQALAPLVLEVRASLSVRLLEDAIPRARPTAVLAIATDTGEPVANGEVTFAVPSLKTKAHGPIQAGRATIEIPLDPATDPGRYEAIVTVHEVPLVDAHPIRIQWMLTAPVELVLSAPERVGQGETFSIHVETLDDLDQRVAGGVVDARLASGEWTRRDAPDGAGTLAVVAPIDAVLGVHPLEVKWRGPPGYVDASATRDVRVVRPTLLTLELPERILANERVTATVRLTTTDGAPLADEQVVVRDEVSDVTVLLTTGKDGTARLSMLAPALQSSALTVAYAGDDRQAPARISSRIDPVVAAPDAGFGVPLTIFGVALAALAAVLALVLRRRHQLQRDVAAVFDRGARQLMAANEYRAAILQTYQWMLEVLYHHDVVPEEAQTLREFEDTIRRRLGLSTPALSELFSVFDEVVYARGETRPEQSWRAFRAFRRVAGELHAHAGPRERGAKDGWSHA